MPPTSISVELRAGLRSKLRRVVIMRRPPAITRSHEPEREDAERCAGRPQLEAARSGRGAIKSPVSVAGQLEECLLERGALGDELVQDDAVRRRELADSLR